MSQYLTSLWNNTVSKYKMLTQEESKTLGEKLFELKALYFEKWFEISNLNYRAENEEDIFKSIQKSDKEKLITKLRDLKQINEEMQIIADELFHGNLRFVMSVARSYFHITGVSIITKLDLYQEGSKGLMRAIDDWDYRIGALQTYAFYWIKQYITRFIYNQSRHIRLPIHIRESIIQMLRAEEKLRHQSELNFDEEPDIYELSEYLESDISAVTATKLAAKQKVLSFSQPVTNSDESACLENSLEDESIEENEKSILANYNKDFYLDIINSMKLRTREKKVIKMRFGFRCKEDNPSGRDHTLEEIGKKFDLTRERIRQIEQKTLKKVKNRLCKLKISNE